MRVILCCWVARLGRLRAGAVCHAQVRSHQTLAVVFIKRDRPGGARARDFVDIHLLATKCKLSLQDEGAQILLREMFAIKRVPLAFLGQIEHHRDTHRADFPSVQSTVSAGVTLEKFDVYFDFVLALVAPLKPLWDV